MRLGKRGTKISQGSQLRTAAKALEYKGKEKSPQFFDYVDPFTRLAKKLRVQQKAPETNDAVTLSRRENRLTRKALSFVCDNSRSILEQEVARELEDVRETQVQPPLSRGGEIVYIVHDWVEYLMSDFTTEAQRLSEVLGEKPDDNISLQARQDLGSLASAQSVAT